MSIIHSENEILTVLDQLERRAVYLDELAFHAEAAISKAAKSNIAAWKKEREQIRSQAFQLGSQAGINIPFDFGTAECRMFLEKAVKNGGYRDTDGSICFPNSPISENLQIEDIKKEISRLSQSIEKGRTCFRPGTCGWEAIESDARRLAVLQKKLSSLLDN